MVYFCYLDESGTPDIPGNTTHYVLSGLAIPINKWKYCDSKISMLKCNFELGSCEVHTAWIARKYIEQTKIPNFEKLNYSDRIYEVEKYRNSEIFRLRKSNNTRLYKQTKKNHKQTKPYIHLTHSERMQFLRELADCVGSWKFARIFAEGIDKIYFNPKWASKNSVDEQALEQVVSRFEQYLQIIDKSRPKQICFGVIIHDNNETVSIKHTELMKRFHARGTLWTRINKIIETPLFVNSELTSLVQIADLCSYSIRRFFENNETDLIDRLKSRFDKKHGKFVGIRHFSEKDCKCFICKHNC